MPNTEKQQRRRVNRFGFAWTRYPEIVPQYESQFLRWIAPLKPEDFRGQRVLDAGCGTGRNSHWALKYGARELVAFDLDYRTVEVARKNLAADPRAVVIESSLDDMAYENEFDIAFCIGVVHHLEDLAPAMRHLVRAVKRGGIVLVWVYAHEGHTRLKKGIIALRRVTCRLPLPVLHVLTYPLSLMAYLYLKCRRHVHPYLRLFQTSSFWHVHSIVFDQLLPETSHYWTRGEALALFKGLPVNDLNIRFVNEGSWTVWARRT